MDVPDGDLSAIACGRFWDLVYSERDGWVLYGDTGFESRARYTFGMIDRNEARVVSERLIRAWVTMNVT
jgi:hypothetical protein